MTETTTAVRRWGNGSRIDSDLAQEQILDAARVCYQRQGVNKTTVEHVAKEAKVSRTTVYRYFKNRDELLTGVVLQDSFKLLEEIQLELEDLTNFGEFLVEAMVKILRVTPNLPLYNAFLGEGSDSSSIINRLCVSSDEVIAIILLYMQPRFDYAEKQGQIREGMTLAMTLEWSARMLLSCLMTPSPVTEDEESFREFLQKMLLPAVMKP